MEIRTNQKVTAKGRTITGYAAVFNSITTIGDFTEVIRSGAFTQALTGGKNIKALYHHQPEAILGTTQAGTLKLEQDAHGLRFEIALPDTTTGNDLAVLVERGDVAGCSFGFSVRDGGEVWTDANGAILRELTDLDLMEITLTADPAYSDTQVAIRSKQEKTHSNKRMAKLYLEALN